MRSTPVLRAAAAAGVVLVTQGSLKDLQRSVRERLLTEAGTAELSYTRVDFSHCAATIQTRTLKAPASREVRLTTTFHLATIAASAGTKPEYSTVTLRSENNAASFRQMEQVIDSGRIREAISAKAELEFPFKSSSTADLVVKGFNRIRDLCKSDDPLLR